MAGFTQFALKVGAFLSVTGWLGVCLAGQEQAGYEQFIANYGQRYWIEKNHPKLVVTQIENEGSASFIWFVCKDGLVYSLCHTSFSDWGGGGGSTVPAANLKRLDGLLSELPDESSQLPPIDRAIIIQFLSRGHLKSYVYDRAKAPDLVWEILRVAQCHVFPWILQFDPQSEIDALRDSSLDGVFGVSPDGQELLFGSENSLQRWDCRTHEFLGEFPNIEVGEGVAFSPDGTSAVVGGDDGCTRLEAKTCKVIAKIGAENRSLVNPQFTTDGHYLLLQSSTPALEIFDTRTWENIPHLPQVPADALKYYPSQNSERAIVQTKPRSLVLWDPAKHKKIAVLDDNAGLLCTSFSPDGAVVAVATASEGEFNDEHIRIRIWKQNSGELVQEIRLFGTERRERVQALGWSKDSRYVLVAASAEINVFNLKTGRLCGDFTGCAGNVCGMALLPKSGQIVAGCKDGKIRFWDFDGALQQIDKFEASLHD